MTITLHEGDLPEGLDLGNPWTQWVGRQPETLIFLRFDLHEKTEDNPGPYIVLSLNMS